MTQLFSGSDDFQSSLELDDVQRAKLFALIEAARSHLCSTYTEATCRYLQEHSGLLDGLVHRLLDAMRGPRSQLDGSSVREWLADTFEQNSLWIRLAEEVWVNVLAWTVQDLDASIAESTIRSLAEEPFRQEVWEALFHPDLLEVQTLLRNLMARLTLELTERLQGAISWEDGAISPGRVEQRGEDRLWVGQGWADGPTEPQIRLTHVLSRSEDFRLLPWELMAQLQHQGGLAMVQLAVLLTAHGMRQPHPESNSFVLRANDVLEQLDWPTSSVSLIALLHAVDRLASLRVISVWMLDSSGDRAEALQVCGRPWEILTDLRGDVDWKTGEIDCPDLVLFTVRPGLWLTQVLEVGAVEAASSFEGFARWMLSLLKLDLCRHPFLLGVLIYLMRSTLSGAADAQVACFSVQELLEAVLQTPAEQILQDNERALALFTDWNRALESLRQMGWTAALSREEIAKACSGTEFYVQPCPNWLSPLNVYPRPLDWVGQWLAQSVALIAPQGVQGLGQVLRRSPRPDAQTPDRTFRKLRFDRLTGSEIRAARKAMRLTQAQLAQALHVHQSLVAKIEAGRRSITEDLELSLRQVLQL